MDILKLDLSILVLVHSSMKSPMISVCLFFSNHWFITGTYVLFLLISVIQVICIVIFHFHDVMSFIAFILSSKTFYFP